MTNERLILISEVLKDRNTDRSTYNTDPKTNVWKGYVQKARDNLALEPMFKVPAGSYIMQFNALKQFKRIPLKLSASLKTSDYDTFTTVPFNIVY